MATNDSRAAVEGVTVSAYRIPTDFPEADGTFAWDATTLVLVEIDAGGKKGIGYTYADSASARLVRDTLAAAVTSKNALDTPACWEAMTRAVRNLGHPGIAAMAISAVDAALWDVKGQLLDLALVTLLGAARDDVPVYGSGGFTSYPIDRLQRQLAGWVRQGISRVKMKVGTQPEADPERVRAAREAIGPETLLYVDANGSYSRKQALAMAEVFDRYGVVWFEEPVPSDDLEGLRLIRDRGPAGMDIAAGEYGYTLSYFRRMLDAGAVDVLQADCTRCAGITGFMRAAAVAQAHGLALSAHCAPSLHAQPCMAIPSLSPIEYFHDHDRIEHLLFEGAPSPVGGSLRPDRSRPGLGLRFKQSDAALYAL